MPFMLGKDPIRRTLKYLQNCKIFFRDNVRIFSIGYWFYGEHHQGARDFVHWHLDRIQYNNPTVQCVKLKNITPTPFIKIYFEDKGPMLIDLDSRTHEEIHDHLVDLNYVTKTREEIAAERNVTDVGNQFIYFGNGCVRHCLCEIQGQLPCSSIVPVPKSWRGIRLPHKEQLKIPPCFKRWGQEIEKNIKME